MNLGTATVLRANARALPIADDSVDLIVTSPPYFGLRSYTDDGEHYDGQIGSEPSPQEFLDALLEVTVECARVLKASGSLWVNLGDKYAGHTNGSGGHRQLSRHRTVPGRTTTGAPVKSLLGLPWRYANRCVDELGLILRAELIWSKPNSLPESVTDRVRRSHEQWFHFTLEPRYYSAIDEIREAYAPGSLERIAQGFNHNPDYEAARLTTSLVTEKNYTPNQLGKLPGSVWTVPTEPLNLPEHLGVDHFAAFPSEWPHRLILGWSPSGVCTSCGEGRRPVTHRKGMGAEVHARHRHIPGMTDPNRREGVRREVVATITGYACACAEPSAPTTPAVVLDPFGGTGTTAMVAKALGRHGITVDMSSDYCRVATWRTNDRNQLAKVLGIAKQPAAAPDQLDLFAEETA